MWYVRNGDKNFGPYPEAQLRQFIAQGKVPPQTYVLRVGTQQWLRVFETPLMQPVAVAEAAPPDSPFDYLQGGSNPSPAAPALQTKAPTPEQLQNPFWTDFAGGPVAGSTPSTTSNPYGYVPLQMRMIVAVSLLALVLVVNIASLVSTWMQIRLLNKMARGVFDDDPELFQVLANANDQRQAMILLVSLGMFLLSLIAFMVWFYRAHANARSMTTVKLEDTPGWAVGFCFIPIMNLFKPFIGMRDIWRASYTKPPALLGKSSPLVGWWWGTSLASNFFARLITMLGKPDKQTTIDDMFTQSYMFLISDCLDFVPLILTIVLIINISNQQARRSLAAH
jgi:hypothetical protein